MHELTDAVTPPTTQPAAHARVATPVGGASLGDLLDRALPQLADACDVLVDHDRARTAAEHCFAAGASPLEALTAAAAATGLEPRLVQLSPRALLASTPPAAVRFVGSGSRGYVTLSISASGRATLLFADGVPCERSLSAEVLASLVDVAGPDAETTWLSATPAAPLAALAGPHGPHGQGHGGGHGGDHSHHPTPSARVRALLRLERDDLWVVLVYAVAVGLLSLVTPVAVQSLVNSVTFGALLQPIVVLTIIVLAVLTFAAALRALQVRVVEAVQRRIFVRVALDVAHRLPRVDLSATDPRYGPELVNRFFDVLTVQKSASIFLLDGLALALQAIIGLLVLAFYHPALLALDAVLLGGAAVVVFGLGRGAAETSIDESKAKYAVAAWLEEVARLPRSFRSSSGSRFAASRADLLARRYLDAREAHFRIVYRQIVGSLALQVVSNGAVLGVGGALVINRQLTLGQLVAAELIVTTVVASIAKLGKHLETWYDLLAAADKLGHLADLPLEPSGHSVSFDEGARGAALHLRNLSFAYDHHHAVLRGLSLDLPPGSRAVLTGSSGAGKTTLASILDGLRLPSGGSVEIDGVDLREAQRAALRERVVVVPREPEVIDGTVLDNIAAGRADVTRRDAWSALRSVGLEERVRALPQGLDTHLGATGAPLHHDATTRLMVARAIAARPRLLVLDDVLGDISAAPRDLVESTIFDPAAPWTLLVLTTPGDPVARRADITAALPASHAATEVH